MDILRGHLLLLTLLAVTAYEDSEMISQREVVPTELLDMLKQGLLVPDSTVRKKGPSISPKSMGPSIPFPLAQPTTDNILAICHYSNIRPRYTEDMLPGGFGYLHRQASAINQLESWFTVCCSNGTQDEEMTQCCAQQAWEKSLANFCNEEFSIKTRHYHCCKQNGQERWDCFKEEAPDPLYQPIVLGDEVPITLPSTIQDFDFNPSICKMTSVSEPISHTKPVNKPPTPQISLQGLPAFKPFSTRPSISFPLAFPNISNIFDICQHRSQRPQHSKETLPSRGFDYLHRQANAVNQLESWYTVCCANGPQVDEQTLCCAQQAWEKSLSDFCEEEFRIKTSHYHCCRRYGTQRWDCFKKEALYMSYHPVKSSGQEIVTMYPVTPQGFVFNPSSCQNTSISEKPVTMLPISFPPGRPNSGNFRPICVFRKYRPHYSTDCLPHKGYERFSYRLKTINGLEKSFRQCCKEKNDGQRCAEEKWKKMVDKFCNYEKKFQENQFECCKKQKGQEQYDCFSATAPNPDYMILNEPIQIGPFLSEFCDVYTDIQKMNLFPVDELTKKCCSPVLTEEATECLQMQLDDIVDAACRTDDLSLTKVRQNCCKKTGQRRSKCLTNMILQKISKAKNMRSNHRICPAYT
ncbi:extracellular matrix protein 1 [Silurus meridionalis]|uniref:Extracellular matrix protein 1 n=1 Tax=Silurus meridionalis TaxID=175797 RepID=A0A8T0BQF3_SILME|nr:extracellular matrix protein 1 [Silurus meridionalis]KAF7708603.1 hypothetical protein HF521_017660 [Silurus meridionalis]